MTRPTELSMWHQDGVAHYEARGSPRTDGGRYYTREWLCGGGSFGTARRTSPGAWEGKVCNGCHAEACRGGMVVRMTTENKVACENCNRMTPEKDVCNDGYCRDCHVSITFEECVDGSWERARRSAAGLPT